MLFVVEIVKYLKTLASVVMPELKVDKYIFGVM